jgi:hypothetical protein
LPRIPRDPSHKHARHFFRNQSAIDALLQRRIRHRHPDDKEDHPATPAITAPTSTPTPGEHDPAADTARRDDRAYHLARVCAQFPRTISTEGAHRLARLLRVSTEQPP